MVLASSHLLLATNGAVIGGALELTYVAIKSENDDTQNADQNAETQHSKPQIVPVVVAYNKATLIKGHPSLQARSQMQ